MKSTTDERLARMLRSPSDDDYCEFPRLHPENHIFTNRTIKLNRIEAVGFDMDYTLAQYKASALDKLTMEMTMEILVNEHHYPEALLAIPYRDDFAIRGLVLDTELGNVLKVDKFRYVSLAYHGFKPLDSHRRGELYNASRIGFNSGRYRSVDTLFELLETYLLAAIIDYFEKAGQALNHAKLFKDIRNAVDLCHRDGRLKLQIMSHPEKFIKDDPLLVPTLNEFKQAGKRLFVITNSEPQYTDFVLSFLFRNAVPFFQGWRDCFQIVGAAARKPLFFKEGTPLEIFEEKDCLYFSGGNIDFLESRLGVTGDKILYVGDHIYGDILKSKHSTSWRTCIIVPELDFQLSAEQATQPQIHKLIANETQLKEVCADLNWLRKKNQDLHQFKLAEADQLEPRHLEQIDDHLAQLNRLVEKNHQTLSRLLYESQQLRRAISNTFNPFWGRLFKTGGQLSNFAELVRDYACIYTSKVSNFSFYGSQTYLKSIPTPMPHEKDLYNFSALNYDAPLDFEYAKSDPLDEPLPPANQLLSQTG